MTVYHYRVEPQPALIDVSCVRMPDGVSIHEVYVSADSKAIAWHVAVTRPDVSLPRGHSNRELWLSRLFGLGRPVNLGSIDVPPAVKIAEMEWEMNLRIAPGGQLLSYLHGSKLYGINLPVAMKSSDRR